MNLTQRIDQMTLKQLIIIAAVIAFIIVAWQNRQIILSKLEMV